MNNILKYVFDKFGCKHEAYDKKDIDSKIETINNNIKTNNTNITNLQNNVYTKDNYAVITGNVSMTDGEGTTNVNYPSGFNKDNCIILSMNIGMSTNTEINYSYGIIPSLSGTATGATSHRASLGNSNIGIAVKNYTDGGNYTFRFKIVLMKI